MTSHTRWTGQINLTKALFSKVVSFLIHQGKEHATKDTKTTLTKEGTAHLLPKQMNRPLFNYPFTTVPPLM